MSIAFTFLITGWWTSSHRLGLASVKTRYLNSVESPRVILVGGSSLHYGVDSEWLESELGVPVINMGLQGSIGMNYMLESVASHLREGDVVVFLGEPALYSTIPLQGQDKLAELISKNPSHIAYLKTSQWGQVVKSVPSAINENLKYLVVYGLLKSRGKKTIREATSKRGDYVGHQGRKSILKPRASGELSAPVVNEHSFSYLQQCESRFKKKGARLVVGFAPIAKSYAHSEMMELITESIPARLQMGKWQDGVYSDHAFFDTKHHLTYDSRRQNTARLAKGIAEKLNWNGLKNATPQR